jgi:hypothetical protein
MVLQSDPRQPSSKFHKFSLLPFLLARRKVTQRMHTAKILYGMLGRPQYISETRPSGSDSPKCLTLVLGRMPGFSHGTSLAAEKQLYWP